MTSQAACCNSIPVINIGGDDLSEIAKALRIACTNEGFFYLEGTDVSPDLFQRVMEQSKKFFQLPSKSKEAIKDVSMSRGYTGMEEETLDPTRQTKGDTKEGFYIGADIPKDDPRSNSCKLMGPNCWPTTKTAPEWTEKECQEFRSIMEEYFQKLSAIGFRLTQLLAMALELDTVCTSLTTISKNQ